MKNAFRRLVRPILERQVKRLVKAKKLKVVAVAGALGKSSTKLAIAEVLRQKYRVLVHPGNFNADISLPLAAFDLDIPANLLNPLAWLERFWQMERKIRGEYPYDVLVLELGTDHPGEIPHFMTYLKPHIGVVTAVAAEHMEFFHTLDAVAAEELALVGGSKKALVNVDDVAAEYLDKYAKGHKDLHGYGLGQGAEFALDVLSVDICRGAMVDVYGERALRMQDIQLALYSRQSVKSAAAAYAVGRLMGLTEGELFDGLEALKPMRGRMNPLPGVEGSLIIDDSYNSSPDSAAAALSALLHSDQGGRRVAVLGSMNEMGDLSAQYHREVGAAAAGVDLLVTIGDAAARWLAPAAVAAGLEPARVRAFASPFAAGAWLAARLKTHDTVLVKGSQNGVFAEEAAKQLLARPADAEQLVRQAPAWVARKRRQFAGLPTAPVVIPYVAQPSEVTCVPTAFYMLALAYGYLNRATAPNIDDFCAGLNWHKDHIDRGWIRPRLSASFRERGWSTVSWQLGSSAPTADTLARMAAADYIGSEREQRFFLERLAGRSLEEITGFGIPAIVSVKAGFATNQDSHVVIITHWGADVVTVLDPDGRNEQRLYDPAYVREYINATGAATVFLARD